MFRVSNDWDDRDYVLSQVKKNGLLLKKASPRLKKDPEIIVEAYKQNWELLDKENDILDPSIFKDINLYRFLLTQSESESPHIFSDFLGLASDEIRSNENLMLSFKPLMRRFTLYLGSKLKRNKDFWKKLISEKPKYFLESPFFDDKEMVLFYLQKAYENNQDSSKPKIANLQIYHGFYDDPDIMTAYSKVSLEETFRNLHSSLQENIEFIYHLWKLQNYSKDFFKFINSRMKQEILRKKDPKRYTVTEFPDEDEDEDEEYADYEDYLDVDEDYYRHQQKSKNVTKTKKNNFSSLFKNNIDKLALSQYKGKKSSVLTLFRLYSYIVDIRSNDIEFVDFFRGKSLPSWKAILKEQIKQFTPDPKVTDTITQSLQVIDAYFKNNKQPLDSPSLQQEKVTLYKASRYKTLIMNLVEYLVSFFNHMGIKVKPLQIVSDVSNIKVIGLMADAGGESPAVSQMASQVTAVKDKLTQILLHSLGFTSIEELENRTYLYKTNGIKYYKNLGNFISLDTLKSYPSEEELLADVKKEKTIDKNYSKFQVSEGKVILKNKVIKSINYLNPQELETKVSEYQSKIDNYNSNLESYEKKLSNDPKTIQLGDHQVNTVKVLYKNISRLVVIDGPYQGHFIDELVSSTGEVIGSVSKASLALTETSKTLKSINKFEIESVFTEPIEFSNLQKVSDYVPKTNIERELDSEYRQGVLSSGIPKNAFHNIVGNNILYNMGYESENLLSTLKLARGRTTTMIDNGTIKGNGEIQISRSIFLINGKPGYISNNLFKTSSCSPDGLGTRIFTQQAKSASEAGFEYIKTLAARGGDYMGYYIWPKVGYNATIDISRENAQYYGLEPLYNYLKAWLRKNSKNSKIKDSVISAPLLDIYACKAKDRFIGQELWKKMGDGTLMKFDLTPGSLSMRILEAYISLKAKKEGLDPKDYLNVDYSRYANYDLACLLKKYMFSPNVSDSSELDRRFRDSIKNYENGELFKIYQDSKTKYLLLDYLGIKYKDPKNKDIVVGIIQVLKNKNIKNKSYDDLIGNVNQMYNLKLASDDQMSEDPMIREIDESIVSQVWDGINKLYESGSFK